LQADVVWTRGEALRTSTFWLLVITFGIASVGVTGMNLHAFAYVTDIGYPTIIAASVMSVMAFTQVCSNLFWGFVAERIDLRKAAAVQFLVQAGGLALAISTNDLALVYVGFFFYGTGLGGSFVLRETIWPNYFGRLSLGTVRGMGLLITLILSAGGAPFFGFLFDATSSYLTPFTIFIGALLLSTLLISLVRPPKKPGAAA
jgi:cyanate permease